MEATNLQRVLEEHPRATGVLFTITLLSMQAGTVGAACCAKTGP